MEVEVTHQRRSRFRQLPKRKIVLNKRDYEIFKYLQRHRFLTSKHIIDLLDLLPHKYSPQTTRWRLRELYDGDYLSRPKERRPHNYNEALPFGLGPKGVAVLVRVLGFPPQKLEWILAVRKGKALNIRHALLLSDIMVALECAAHRTGNTRIVPAHEIIRAAPERTQKRANPHEWRVQVPNVEKRVAVCPDKIFALHFRDQRKDPDKLFFLEADTGSMPVTRRGLDTTSYYRKLLAYYETWVQGRDAPPGQTPHGYNIKPFRVLTVTKSRERVDNMLAAQREIGPVPGYRIFLFTDIDTFRGSDPLEVQWFNGRGELELLMATKQEQLALEQFQPETTPSRMAQEGRS